MEGHASVTARRDETGAVWEPRSTPPPLAAGAVQVWRISLDPVPPPIDALHALLAPDEQAAVARLRFANDRARRIAGRACARLVLAAHLGVSPAAVAIQRGVNGRPAIPNSVFDFNISHSGGRVLIAVCREGRVGVDIEHIRALDAKELAVRFFTDSEAVALNALTGSELLAAFFTCWTRKEAIAKLTGDGLPRPLDQVVVWPSPRLDVYGMHDLHAGDQYAAAVATSDPSATVSCFDLVL